MYTNYPRFLITNPTIRNTKSFNVNVPAGPNARGSGRAANATLIQYRDNLSLTMCLLNVNGRGRHLDGRHRSDDRPAACASTYASANKTKRGLARNAAGICPLILPELPPWIRICFHGAPTIYDATAPWSRCTKCWHPSRSTIDGRRHGTELKIVLKRISKRFANAPNELSTTTNKIPGGKVSFRRSGGRESVHNWNSSARSSFHNGSVNVWR